MNPKSDTIYLQDNINISDSITGANILPLHNFTFEEAKKILDNLVHVKHPATIISYILLITGFEQYINYNFRMFFQSKPRFVKDAIDNNTFSLNSMTIDNLQNKYKGKTFGHFDLPEELFEKASQELKFRGIIKHLVRMNNKPDYKYHSQLVDLYTRRNIFMHFWPYPEDGFEVDEKGNRKDLKNNFEEIIRTTDKKFIIQSAKKILDFMNYIDENEQKTLSILKSFT